MAAHLFGLRVYYEDTDLAGIVYYANYLKFMERGRTEALREYGVDQGRLKDEAGLVFAVRRIEVDYLMPARFGDWLEVVTGVQAVRGASVEMVQEVRRDGELLAAAKVRIACMTGDARVARIPGEIRAMLGQIGREEGAGH